MHIVYEKSLKQIMKNSTPYVRMYIYIFMRIVSEKVGQY